jgi:hypothetical protein
MNIYFLTDLKKIHSKIVEVYKEEEDSQKDPEI